MANNSTVDTYEEFIEAFRSLSGLDLKSYKQTQMQRRIISFMNSRGHTHFQNFLHALQQDTVLYDAFFKHLTINVTQFFRDANQWENLRKGLLPNLVNGKQTIKIWSAGCSSGQEAYSLAITMAEYFPGVRFSIVGTDIDANVLQQAKEGIYKKADFDNTPPELLAKYFVSTSKEYQIRESIKQHVTFQRQNLLTDQFASDFDLIACRNVVIYFTEEAKETLYRKFIAALRPGGILFTGSTEYLFRINHLGLKPVASFFYQKLS